MAFLPTVLIVLDGWGVREDNSHNPIAMASTPFYDALWRDMPHTVLDASEEYVGLPAGQMGNSEIGHMTIGAGAIIATDLIRISKAIEDKSWHSNGAFAELFAHVKKNNSTLHVQGLLSPGGVHSHHHHLYAFLEAAKEAGITRIAIHAFTDGRDTPPQSAAGYLAQLEALLERVGVGFIATVAGRFYAMDRDNNWDRLARVEAALFDCQGSQCDVQKPSEVLKRLYAQGKLDEHIEPLVFTDAAGKHYPIQDNDGVFFFNFRSDRARMLSKRIIERSPHTNLLLVTMTQYDESFECRVAFPPIGVATTLAAEVAAARLTQAHIAETEKYAHATYFFNGGRQEPHEGEVHVLVESRRDVVTHDKAPKMRAAAIADKAIEQVDKGTHFIFINFANADMVGHTANEAAIVEAVQELDRQLERVVKAVQRRGGCVVVTADHGNAELSVDPVSGEKHTAHTLNRVPFIVTAPSFTVASGGTLADVAPTVLGLLGLAAPASMTGHNLLT